jgi:hypothetical protein
MEMGMNTGRLSPQHQQAAEGDSSLLGDECDRE